MKEKNDSYYIQNGYLSNDILWWSINSKRYTTDINKAGKYTKEEVDRIISRPGDVAWLCNYIDKKEKTKRITIDIEYLDIKYKLKR